MSESQKLIETDPLDDQIVAVMKALSGLSNDAKATGDLPTMYAVNQAWRRLFLAREDRQHRLAALRRAAIA